MGGAIFFSIILAVGVGVKVASQQMENPFGVEYDHSWLRMVTLTSTRDMAEVVEPLRQWAQRDGYKFRAGSPAGKRGSVSIMIWRGQVIMWGVNKLDAPGLSFSVYWEGDSPDK